MPDNYSKGNASIYFFCILAAYAILGLLVFVPNLLLPGNPSTLVLIGIILVVIVVLLFAAAIIFRGLAKLFHKF
ncbi:hypothetical protein [Sporosarcina jiandibaonis]|uniref:hypothetical protein n=1 Tax=Sporosarcina jiandibaonis TaxID=2715535 RepID=UPI001555DEA1|nr:hypothetical protein [Sporosarcina jiandibaonis]